MREEADVVVIGGGVTGCGIAYNLAKKGLTDVIVLERQVPCVGASGRCGGGIRQQFTTDANITLAMESVRLFEQLSVELDTDIEYEQGGYLIIAYEDEVDQFKRNVRLQNSLGLESRFITPEEAREIVPLLNIDPIAGATFCQTDGHANPFRVVHGYARKAQKMGVEISKFTAVTGIVVEDGQIRAVKTDKGTIKTNTVVNAAGAYSRDIASMVGVSLPNKPYRHEILVTEPVEHVLDPMVISFKTGVYFSQQKHGPIIGGIGDPEEPSSYNISASLRFMKRMARTVVELVPAFGHLNVLRQWAGLYDVTPDAQPVLGWTEGVDQFCQANGYSGHGFMIAPKVTELIAELIVDGKPSMPIDDLNLKRFEGEITGEAYVVG
ncbi:MAG: FAD-binding oxidoreductase [Theionarchaea archaeon]|nr:FAD-binding oxidoreductase [Theionarchaea archaeon]MBU7019892.1 FAD-binding oxidoreductase [Theionarchaea archaeon]MBU7041815.1 FAD-binding oxidoreductase [Theionarchaea archaeon]